MILNIYTIKDTIIGEFQNPIISNNDKTMQRALKETMLDKENDLYKYSKDLQLFKLGEYNTQTGEIKNDVQFILNLGDLTNGI